MKIEVTIKNMKDAEEVFKYGQRKARRIAKQAGISWLNCEVVILMENPLNKNDRRLWKKYRGYESLMSY